jgi:amino acid transporter
METKYRSLRFIAAFLKVLAWVALVLGILGALLVIGVAAYYSFTGVRAASPLSGVISTSGRSLVRSIAGGLGLGLVSLIYFLLLTASSDMIQLQMDIEQNTREMANALRPKL